MSEEKNETTGTKRNGFTVVMVCYTALALAFTLISVFYTSAMPLLKPLGVLFYLGITALGAVVAALLFRDWPDFFARHRLLNRIQEKVGLDIEDGDKVMKSGLVFLVVFFCLMAAAIAMAPIYAMTHSVVVQMTGASIILAMLVWLGIMATGLPVVVTAEVVRDTIRSGWHKGEVAVAVVCWITYFWLPFGVAFATATP